MRNSQQEIAAPKACKEVIGKRARKQKLKETRTVPQDVSYKKDASRSAGFPQTKKITYIAALTAVAFILKTLGNVFMIGGFKVSFVYIPWIVAGITLGPLGGTAVAFITDILGTLAAGNAPNPLLAAGSALFPLFPALFYKLPVKNDALKIAAGTAVSVLVCTLGLNTLGLTGYLGIPFPVLFIQRLVTQTPVVTLNLVGVCLLMPTLKKRGITEAFKSKP